MRIIQAEVLFDSPTDPRPSKFENKPDYRTITLGVPGGAPKAQLHADSGRYQVYHYFNVGTDEETFWLSKSKGDVVQMAWVEQGERSYYQPVKEDDGSNQTQQAQPAQSYDKASYTSTSATTRNDLSWLDEEYREAVVALGKHIVSVVSQLIDEAMRSGYDDESIAQRIGVTAFIEAKRAVERVGPERALAVSDDTSEEAIIRGISTDNLPESLLQAIPIASPHIEDRNEAVTILKRFELSSDNIDENPETWVWIYSVARAYAYATKVDGMTPDEATTMIAENWGIDLGSEEQEPF